MEPVSRSLAARLSNCATSQLWAEQDEGPYHRDAQPLRHDILEDREGLALQLGVRLVRNDNIAVQDATVEIWHCDALGQYSGFPPPDGATAPATSDTPRAQYVRDQTFLRGGQQSDAAGLVEFHTIYPGWYPGRTIHIHVMVHVGDSTLTSQLYFPEDVNEEVLLSEPYSRRANRDTTNTTDAILPTGGKPALLDLTRGQNAYQAAICLVLPKAGRPS